MDSDTRQILQTYLSGGLTLADKAAMDSKSGQVPILLKELKEYADELKKLGFTANDLDKSIVTDSNDDLDHIDYNPEPMKRLVRFAGLRLRITHDPGDTRNGWVMPHSYGVVEGLKDPHDKMGTDVILGDPSIERLYKVRQLKENGAVDQHKVMAGFPTIEDAKQAFLSMRPPHMFGGIEEVCASKLIQEYGTPIAKMDSLSYFTVDIKCKNGKDPCGKRCLPDGQKCKKDPNHSSNQPTTPTAPASEGSTHPKSSAPTTGAPDTFAEWKKQTGGTLTAYRKELKAAIAEGHVPSDEAIASAGKAFKLTKVEQNKLSENKQARTAKPPVKAEQFTSPDKLREDREDLVKDLGEKAVRDLEVNAQKIMDNASVYSRVKDQGILEKIIDDRFKSQFETGTSGGALNTRYRAAIENSLMNYSLKTDPADRPIYGYMSEGPTYNNGLSGNATFYGKVAIRLKSSVKDRTTVTLGDSLNNETPASPVNKINAASLVPPEVVPFVNSKDPTDQSYVKTTFRDISKAKNISQLTENSFSPYVEAQVHGRVLPSDIEEIHIHQSLWPPSAKVEEWTKANGVKISQFREVGEKPARAKKTKR